MINEALTLGRLDASEFAIAMAGIGVAALWIISSTVKSVLQTRAREETRREMAAYVAEGSISPSEAKELLEAETSELEKKIGDAVAWGTLSAKKAEDLIRASRESKHAEARQHT